MSPSNQSQADEEAFLEGVRRHGRDAKLIARDMGSRTIGAVKKFYQKNRKCASFQFSYHSNHEQSGVKTGLTRAYCRLA